MSGVPWLPLPLPLLQLLMLHALRTGFISYPIAYLCLAIRNRARSRYHDHGCTQISVLCYLDDELLAPLLFGRALPVAVRELQVAAVLQLAANYKVPHLLGAALLVALQKRILSARHAQTSRGTQKSQSFWLKKIMFTTTRT